MSQDVFENQLDFTIDNLQTIYIDLVRWLDQGNDKEANFLIERIKQMIEFQVWGEQNNETFFDFFCEKKIIDLLLKILKKTHSRDIVNEIIINLSMYLVNIKKPINLNYILSNNAINELITHPYDFEDDEIVDYYINFLKGLSLRIETIPLEILYNQKYIDFPLLNYATRFYNYPSSMVRAAVQNLTLNILKVQHDKLDVYVTNFPFVHYFVNLVCYLRDLWISIEQVLPDSYIKNHSKLNELLDDQYDLLVYIDDIFKLGREKINQILSNTLLSYLIIPHIIAPLTSNERGVISLNLAQYLINQIFTCFSYPPLLEAVFIYLFSPKLNQALLNLLHEVPREPSSYQKKWSFVTYWDQYEDSMVRQYTLLLKKAGTDINEKNNQSPFVNRAFHSQKPSPGLFSFLNVGQRFFGTPEISKEEGSILEENKSLTQRTGVVSDLSIPQLESMAEETPLEIIRRFLDLFTESGDPLSMNMLKDNPIRTIFQLFLLSKDDNMIALMCSVLNAALNNQSLSNKVICLSGYVCEYIYYKRIPMISDNKTSLQNDVLNKNFTVKYILDLLFKLLVIDPVFRLSTMTLIAKLIMELSWTKTEKIAISKENLKIFNTGYSNAIAKTLKMLQANTMTEYYAEIHNQQWDKIYKNDLEEISRRNLMYTLFPVVEGPAPGVDAYMRLPANQYETLQEAISVFFLFRKIRYSLIRITKYSREFIEGNDAIIKNDNASNSWEEGKFYELDQRKLLPCYIKNKGNKQFCYIAEDEENFILITPDYTKVKWAHILHNTKLKHVEATVDRGDPRHLMIIIKTKDKFLNKILIFDDHTICLAAKKMVQESRKFSQHFETTKVLEDIEKARNDIFVG